MTGAAVVETHTVRAHCTGCGALRVFLARIYDNIILDSAHGVFGAHGDPNGWVCDTCIGPEAVECTESALARWGTL